MPNEWKVFIAEDTDGFVWIIYSINPNYATLRLKDFGIHTSGVRDLTEEETSLYEDEIEVAIAHKNIAVFVLQSNRDIDISQIVIPQNL